MAAMSSVSHDDYVAAVAGGASSDRFKRLYAEVRGGPCDGWDTLSFFVHDGDLRVDGDWHVPGFHTLIRGDLVVDGVVDLGNRIEEGFDEGGEFVVLGDLRCEALCHHYSKISYVDGDLEARQLLNNDFNYSSLRILGDLRTPLFYAPRNPAEVGGRAVVERIVGRLKLLCAEAEPEPMEPLRRGDLAGLDDILDRSLDVQDPDLGWTMAARVRAGLPIFRQR